MSARHRLRREEAGAIHHVFARGNNRAPIFLGDEDRAEYLTLLGAQVRRVGWNLLGFCLMGNHVHLVVETVEPTLGRGMRTLHMQYAKSLHGRAGRIGHMFNERYGSSRLLTDARLRGVLAYVALNPVEAGICPEPEDWPWSSFGALVRAGGGDLVAWPRLAELCGVTTHDLLASHRAWIEAVRLVGSSAPIQPGQI